MPGGGMARSIQQRAGNLRLGRGRDLPPEDQDGMAEGYRGIGAELAAVRAQIGWSLEDVAARIRIRPAHLAAIEQGRFDQLPGRIYATGFLRAYGELLGLDPALVVERFRSESSAAPVAAPLAFPVPAPESRSPRGWLLVLALLLGAGVYGGWYWLESREPSLALTVPPAPEQVERVERVEETPPAAVADRTAVAPPAPQAATPVLSTMPQPESADMRASDPLAPEYEAAWPADAAAAAADGGRDIEVASLPADVPPVAAAAEAEPQAITAPDTAAATWPTPQTGDYVPQVYGTTNTDVRVVLRAHGESWIDVRGSDNEVLLPGRVLRAGDSYRVPNRTDVVLWTGNLGALELVVDGQPLPRLGNFGEARRNISLDPARLLAGAALSR